MKKKRISGGERLCCLGNGGSAPDDDVGFLREQLMGGSNLRVCLFTGQFRVSGGRCILVVGYRVEIVMKHKGYQAQVLNMLAGFNVGSCWSQIGKIGGAENLDF